MPEFLVCAGFLASLSAHPGWKTCQSPLNTGLNGYKLYCFSNKCTFDASGKAEIDPGITAANGIVLATLSGNGSSVIYNTAFVSGKIVMYAKHIATGTVYIGSSWVGGILFYE